MRPADDVVGASLPASRRFPGGRGQDRRSPGPDRRRATATVPAGAFHFQRNDTDQELDAVEQYRPALQMQQFFEVLIGWANDGKTDEHGLPTLLRRAAMHRYFRSSIRFRKTQL